MALSPRGASADRAVAWSLAGHGLLVLIVVLGGLSLPHSPPRTQLAIKATVVDAKAGARPRAAKPRPVPKPEVTDVAKPEPRPEPNPEPKPEAKPEPKPPPKAETPPAPKPDPKVEQRKAAQQMEKQKLEREKAAARKAEAEQAKAQAEQLKAEQAKAEAEKQKAAKEKAEAERRRAAEDAAARDVDRQLEEEERLLAAEDSGALAAYADLIAQKVERNWVRPPGAKPGIECEVVVTQIPGGEVTAARVERCNADDVVRRSIEAAVLRASPLPPPDDSALFDRNLRFTFKPEQ